MGVATERADGHRILVIGAGMTGLSAAAELRRHGVAALVLDKSRAPGGRMSSRSIGDARFDQGAQHIGARDPGFRAQMGHWVDAGVAAPWFRAGSAGTRFVGVGGMRAIPEQLAVGLDVHTGVTVTAVERSASGPVVRTDDGRVMAADGVILTPPLPQLLALLDAGGVVVPAPLRSRLDGVRYDACLAVMARLDGPSGLPDGHRSFADGPIAWLGDNQHKGTSAAPAVTIHSSAPFAAEHLDAGADRWVPLLADAAAEHLDASIVEPVGHRWRYAEPQQTFADGATVLGGPGDIVLAGEVFAGARVEGAFLSGLAAAAAVLGPR